MKYIEPVLILILALVGCSGRSLELPTEIGESLTFTAASEISEPASTPNLSSKPRTGMQVESSPTVSHTATDVQGTPGPTQTLNAPSDTDTNFPQEVVRTCTQVPEKFYYRDLGIDWINRIRFESDDLITFEGWGTRKQPDVQPMTPFPTPEPGPNPFGANIELKAGQIDLTSRVVSSREINPTLLDNPCNEQCPLQVLSTSRDQRWQLIQISDWTDELVGIWLVGEDEKVKLLSYIPDDSDWSWAEDNTLLWYRHNLIEYGEDTQIVELRSPLLVYDHLGRGPNDPLDATYFRTAFSPKDKTIRSTENPFTQGFPDDDIVYVADVSSHPFIAEMYEVIPGITDIVWNETTDTFLYSVYAQTSTDYWLHSIGKVATLPIESMEALHDSEGNDISQLNAQPADAISASGTEMVRALSSGYIQVYSCP